MTQSRTHIPFAYRAYIVFVAGMIMSFAVFGLLPFISSGACVFSPSQISSQTGVPGYPLDGLGLLMVMLSGLLAPIISFPPLLVWGPMLLRGEIAPAVRRVLLPAMLAYVLFGVFVFTYGSRILTWILD